MNDPAVSRLHQLTVDTYAAQHSGGSVPLITTAFALIGLYLAVEKNVPGLEVGAAHKRFADRRRSWPRFIAPTTARWPMTILDIALAESAHAHQTAVEAWAAAVWRGWRDHHAAIAALTRQRPCSLFVERTVTPRPRAARPARAHSRVDHVLAQQVGRPTGFTSRIPSKATVRACEHERQLSAHCRVAEDAER